MEQRDFDQQRIDRLVARLGEFFGDKSVDYSPASEHCDDSIFIRGSRDNGNCASIAIRFCPRTRDGLIRIRAVEIGTPLNSVLREFGCILGRLAVPIRDGEPDPVMVEKSMAAYERGDFKTTEEAIADLKRS